MDIIKSGLRHIAANWKTSLAGPATAFFGFVAFKPQYFPHWLGDLAVYLAAGGGVVFGLAAKDANKTGGTSLNEPSIPRIDLPGQPSNPADEK